MLYAPLRRERQQQWAHFGFGPSPVSVGRERAAGSHRRSSHLRQRPSQAFGCIDTLASLGLRTGSAAHHPACVRLRSSCLTPDARAFLWHGCPARPRYWSQPGGYSWTFNDVPVITWRLWDLRRAGPFVGLCRRCITPRQSAFSMPRREHPMPDSLRATVWHWAKADLGFPAYLQWVLAGPWCCTLQALAPWGVLQRELSSDGFIDETCWSRRLLPLILEIAWHCVVPWNNCSAARGSATG